MLNFHTMTHLNSVFSWHALADTLFQLTVYICRTMYDMQTLEARGISISPSAELDRITFAEEMARFAWNYLIAV